MDDIDTRMAEVVKFCCGDDKWRGHFCPYHSGYDDGLAEAADEIERLRADQETLLGILEVYEITDSIDIADIERIAAGGMP